MAIATRQRETCRFRYQQGWQAPIVFKPLADHSMRFLHLQLLRFTSHRSIGGVLFGKNGWEGWWFAQGVSEHIVFGKIPVLG